MTAAIEPVRLLHVELELSGTVLPVGRLAWRDGRIFFEYDGSFLGRGLSLSPFHLPLAPGVVEGPREPFEGLHGLFSDSLPDGWGRLLLERGLSRLGLLPSSLTPLDRLAWVGSRGMAALRYRPEHAAPGPRERSRIDLRRLDRLAEEARRVLQGEASAVLDTLLDLGGSSGGARPKILVGRSATGSRLLHGVDELPEGYTHWLVKFRSSSDEIDAGAVELAYSRMARAAGIEMAETALFPSRHGPGHFGTARFDRSDNRRIHVHTACGLLHADYRIPSLGYAGLLKAARALTRSQPEVDRLYRRTVFNVLAHNRDDHTRNHSFLMKDDGGWILAPAYDLTFSSGPAGEHALDVAGEGRAPGHSHLMAVAEAAGVPTTRARSLIDEVRAAIDQWPSLAQACGVAAATTKAIDRRLNGPRRPRRRR